MFLPKGSKTIPINEPLHIEHTEFYIYSDGHPHSKTGSYAIRMTRLSHQAFHNLDPKIIGIPTSYYLDHDNILRFWPTTDKEYYARFSFNPLRKEI
jgi:hypothetical protein